MVPNDNLSTSSLCITDVTLNISHCHQKNVDCIANKRSMTWLYDGNEDLENFFVVVFDLLERHLLVSLGKFLQ